MTAVGCESSTTEAYWPNEGENNSQRGQYREMQYRAFLRDLKQKNRQKKGTPIGDLKCGFDIPIYSKCLLNSNANTCERGNQNSIIIFEQNDPMNYECFVCYERCKAPASCTRCLKLMCKQHISRCEDRCPYCRLEPFVWKDERIIGELISIQIYREREDMKKNRIFKCLVEDCKYQGKYHAMMKHRKKAHYHEKIEEIIFPQERERKVRRDTLKKLIAARLGKNNSKIYQKAFFLHSKTEGKVPLVAMLKLVQHIEICRHESCKKIIVTDYSAFIGTVNPTATETLCPNAAGIKFVF